MPDSVTPPFLSVTPKTKPPVLKSLAKGLRLKCIEDAEERYQTTVGIYEKKIYPSVDGIRNVISRALCKQRKGPPAQGRGLGGRQPLEEVRKRSRF